MFARQLKGFILVKSVEVIERETFGNCVNMRTFSFESGSRIRCIKRSAFEFSGLFNFTVPSSVMELGDYIFFGCDELDTLVFENESRIWSLPGRIFPKSGVRVIWFHDGMEILVKESIYGCKSLESVSFSANTRLRRIEAQAFSKSILYSFNIPGSVEFVHPLAFDKCKISMITVDESSLHLRMLNGFLATKDRNCLIRYYGSESLVEIPKDAIEIGKYCFMSDSTLESVHFEAGSKVKSLGKRAFAETYIQTIRIPGSVELIKKECFADCEALDLIVFEANPPPNEIEETAIPSGIRRYISPAVG